MNNTPRPPDGQLATLFRDSTSGLAPDVADLVAGGIVRGRSRRRRRRVGTTLAAVAVVGVIGVAAGVAPGLVQDGRATGGAPAATGGPSEKPSTSPTPEPTLAPRTDAAIAIAAEDIPAAIAAMLPPGDLGPVLREHPYPVVNERDKRIVHFRWDGALTTFTIEPAADLASCQELADPGAGSCATVDGVEMLTTPASTQDRVTVSAVMVWRYGYVVSALSYNAPAGKDVAPIFDAPPITTAQLTEIASSVVWFR